MSWFDIFFAADPVLKVPEPLWTTPVNTDRSFNIEALKVSAESDGTIKVDIDGTTLTIGPTVRHAFLDKIRKAVQMADVADPDNDQLNGELTR